jgi:hypothetical protein
MSSKVAVAAAILIGCLLHVPDVVRADVLVNPPGVVL